MEQKILNILDNLLIDQVKRPMLVIEYKGKNLTFPNGEGNWNSRGEAKQALLKYLPYLGEEMIDTIEELERKKVIKYNLIY